MPEYIINFHKRSITVWQLEKLESLKKPAQGHSAALNWDSNIGCLILSLALYLKELTVYRGGNNI